MAGETQQVINASCLNEIAYSTDNEFCALIGSDVEGHSFALRIATSELEAYLPQMIQSIAKHRPSGRDSSGVVWLKSIALDVFRGAKGVGMAFTLEGNCVLRVAVTDRQLERLSDGLQSALTAAGTVTGLRGQETM